MSEIDLYNILGVSKTAKPTEIKKAYHKLALKEHPDKGGDKEKFRKVKMAYEILSDEEKREKYDFFGIEGLDDALAPEGATMRKHKPEDTICKLAVSLEDLYKGKTSKLSITRSITDKNSIKKCSTCNGQGVHIRIAQIQPGVIQQIQTVCPACKGQKQTFTTIQQTETIEVHIDAGAGSGTQIRVNEMGNENINKEAGDIVFVINEKEHHTFERNGNNLLIRKSISLEEALYGCKFTLKTLDNRSLSIKTPVNHIIHPHVIDRISVVPNTMLVVGEGMSKPNTGGLEKGDMYVVFSIDFPTYNSETHKKLQELFPKEENKEENKEEYTLQIGHYRDYEKPINQENPNEPHVQQCAQS
tara:strand:+ start:5034 stop:6107 length:1074 start_codon:yes stop_codon:yes gene_type:complete